jgi:hypothetical protein
MDHSCHRCHQPVEDGVPFCANCGAPQIRVLLPEPVPAAALATDSSPSNVAIGVSSPADLMVPLRGSWSQTWRPCTWAAGVAVLAMVLHLYPAVAMFGAGIVAVSLYRQQFPGIPMRAVLGAKLGALSALIGFISTTLLGLVAVLALHKEAEVRQVLLDGVQQAIVRANGDAQTIAVLDYFKTSQGLIVLAAIGLVMALFFSIALGSLGGALAGSFTSRRNRS